MPSRTPFAAVGSVFNFISLLRALPPSLSQSSSQASVRCSACMFSTTAPQLSIKKKRKQKKSQDPYRAAQAKQRKAANIARQSTLQAQRQAALGDPVRSKPTAFLGSLRDPSSYNPQAQNSSYPAPSASEQHLNYFLQPSDVAKQLLHSKWLSEPIALSELDPTGATAKSLTHDPNYQKARTAEWESAHANAESAIQRITALPAGSSKDRTRVNLQRCIEEFGRHNTDLFLAPKPASLGQTGSSGTGSIPPRLSETEAAAAAELSSLPKRVGKDTGSSEVQAAMLTVKINTLAENLHKKDKNNKRNLRLLVHRRQKLLKYLRRKERGGPRWTHLVEKLGINDAMWKGEISM